MPGWYKPRIDRIVRAGGTDDAILVRSTNVMTYYQMVCVYA